MGPAGLLMQLVKTVLESRVTPSGCGPAPAVKVPMSGECADRPRRLPVACT